MSRGKFSWNQSLGQNQKVMLSFYTTVQSFGGGGGCVLWQGSGVSVFVEREVVWGQTEVATSIIRAEVYERVCFNMTGHCAMSQIVYIVFVLCRSPRGSRCCVKQQHSNNKSSLISVCEGCVFLPGKIVLHLCIFFSAYLLSASVCIYVHICKHSHLSVVWSRRGLKNVSVKQRVNSAELLCASWDGVGSSRWSNSKPSWGSITVCDTGIIKQQWQLSLPIDSAHTQYTHIYTHSSFRNNTLTHCFQSWLKALSLVSTITWAIW